MANTNQQRRDLFNSLEQAIGANNADFVMELLPNQPADQLVTRTDLHVFGDSLRSELKGEMAELRAELKGDMTELRAELKGEMAELRGEMNMRFATAKVETQRLIVAGMAANAIAVITALAT